VTGMSYRQYTDRYIVRPLKLRNTGSDIDSRSRSRLSHGYSPEVFRSIRHAYPHVSTGALASATGFYSNAEDLCRYLGAHFYGNTSLLSDASKRHMQHGYWITDGDGSSYGLGMSTYKSGVPDMIGHGGGFPGFITNSRFDPTQQLAISVLTNAGDAPAALICDQILKIIVRFQQCGVPRRKRVTSLNRFAGRYCATRWLWDLVEMDDKVLLISPIPWTDFSNAEELSLVDRKTLKITKAGGFCSPGELVHFDFSSRGRATSITCAGATLLSEPKARLKGWITAEGSRLKSSAGKKRIVRKR